MIVQTGFERLEFFTLEVNHYNSTVFETMTVTFMNGVVNLSPSQRIAAFYVATCV